MRMGAHARKFIYTTRSLKFLFWKFQIDQWKGLCFPGLLFCIPESPSGRGKDFILNTHIPGKTIHNKNNYRNQSPINKLDFVVVDPFFSCNLFILMTCLLSDNST